MQDIKSFKRKEEPAIVAPAGDPVVPKTCKICGRELNTSDPKSVDCGGDCQGCIDEIEKPEPVNEDAIYAEAAALEAEAKLLEIEEMAKAPVRPKLILSLPPTKTLQPEDVKMSGDDAETDEEEYRRIFNGEVGEVSKMTNDELQDHIHKLMTVVKVVKIRWKASYITYAQRLEDESVEERKRLAARDKEYKVKRAPKADGEKVTKIKAVGKTVEDKAVSALMQMLGCTEERAKAIIAKQKDSK